MHHHIIGGGTLFHVRPHLAIAAPARGTVAKKLYGILNETYLPGEEITKHLTKMAGGDTLETNKDIEGLIDQLVDDPTTKMIFIPAALCDFEGSIIDERFEGKNTETPSGKDQPRLHSKVGEHLMLMRPAEKVVSRVRQNRKDIFLVTFKVTAGASSDEQFEAGLELLKRSSSNLVLANDIRNRRNMVITPEQARYYETTNREAALRGLVKMARERSKGTFTRSTIVQGEPVPWSSPLVPDSLRAVVNHCIQRGAYKPFLGSTVGHFAVKLDDTTFLTSRRKTDFNKLDQVGLVKVESSGPDSVIAHGSRPSVGGQSQRIVFEEHRGLDCIVHMHVPLRASHVNPIPVRPQWLHECGSHQCGKNTSDGLKGFSSPYQEAPLKAVMLDQHGPNIVFHRSIDPRIVIDFIEANFDLEGNTSGVVTRRETPRTLQSAQL